MNTHSFFTHLSLVRSMETYSQKRRDLGDPNPLYRKYKIRTKIIREGRILGGEYAYPDEVEAYIPEFYRHWTMTQLSPVLRAAKAYQDLISMHIFYNGNGRTTRLLVDYMLMSGGYPPPLLEVDYPNMANVQSVVAGMDVINPAPEYLVPLSHAVDFVVRGVERAAQKITDFGVSYQMPPIELPGQQSIDALTYRPFREA